MFKRIGIYPGTFDPVHTGHIAFALQSREAAKLDKIYFLPERRPRDKQNVEHFAHRVAMLRDAIKPHPQFKVIELVDISFNVQRTLPKLQSMFEGDELVFLFGSDIAKKLGTWPLSERLLTSSELVIGLRHEDKREEVKDAVESWPGAPLGVRLVDSFAPEVSSSKVRNALRLNRQTRGVLRSVEKYSNRNWLYISLAVDKP